MKLLGWMHRKFRQNSTEQFKELVIGKAAGVDDERNYQYLKPNFGSKHVKQIEKDLHNLRKSFTGYEEDAAKEDEEYLYEEDGAMYELFHGFLAIGTLGLGCSTDPSATPTFGNISVVENITEKELDEVTENELKLINDELEKVLGDDESNSARNSHVSSTGTAGRSSHGSIISLSSGKPMMEGNANGTSICPLQGYLFGSAASIELPKVAAAKRTSLGELFQRTKLADQENDKITSSDQKEEDKSALLHLVKKKLKKRILLHTSSRNSTSTNAGPVDSVSADRKLSKILHMFHRKVHPENSTAEAEPKNESKNKTINYNCNRGGHNKLENKQHHKSQSNPLGQLSLGNDIEDSAENREHWIKTDSDYLVLEL